MCNINKIINISSVLIVAILFNFAIINTSFSQWESDQWLEKPVSDEIFTTYLDFFEYEDKLDFKLNIRETTNNDGIYKERITFQSTDAMDVTADYYRPQGASADSQRPHIIVVHGGSPSGKDGTYNRIVKGLIRSGMNVLAIDLLHFGERKTGLLTTFKNDDKAKNLYNRKSFYLEWVIQTTKDVSRSVDLLLNHYNASADSIAYLGLSRGAEMGFIVTGVEKRFSAVALLISGRFDALETGHLAAACPANYVGRISPTPTFLLNGKYDSDYDAEKSVKPLHRLFGGNTEVHWMDSGHSITKEGLQLLNNWFVDTFL